MSTITLQLTPHDPIIARDGRPFGVGQGNRMRGLPWPLPSVVAGSLRTALVKAGPELDFSGEMPRRLMGIEVAGIFPTVGKQLYLPAPIDAVAEPTDDGTGIKTVHRVMPRPEDQGCDFPDDLRPVMLLEKTDFKPAEMPSWWPLVQVEKWLVGESITFDESFLNSPIQETRDHVSLDADLGASADGQLFATTGLNVSHLPRFHAKQEPRPFAERFAEIALSARITLDDSRFGHLETFDTWHPLGGERRLVHWRRGDDADLWACPLSVKTALATAERIRMVLATPAIFAGGWKPDWLNDQLEGTPPGTSVRLKLVGVRNARWKAVSGWSLARVNSKGELDPEGNPGPKSTRRMVPAGGVYFFEKVGDDTDTLADRWLQSVSDHEQDRRDGFGLAVWGIW